MDHLAAPAPARTKPLAFPTAVVAVLVPRLLASIAVRVIWLALPLYGGWSSYGSWNSYLIGYTLAVSVAAAAGVAVIVRIFGYKLSYAAALIALFAGDLAGLVVYRAFVVHAGRSPHVFVPYRSVFGLVGLMVSLLLSGWLVQVFSERYRHRSTS
jgi:hypothetical protein